MFIINFCLNILLVCFFSSYFALDARSQEPKTLGQLYRAAIGRREEAEDSVVPGEVLTKVL